MPIVSADKFNYFRPEAGVSNIKAPSFTPTAPVSPDDVSKLAGAYQLRVGDELEQMGRVIRQAQVRDDVQRYTLKALEDVATAEVEEMQAGSHRDLPARFNERLKGIHQKYRDEIGGDQEVYGAFQEKFGILATNHTQKVRLASWRKELDQQQATTIEGGDSTLRLIGTTSSPKEAQTLQDDFLRSVDEKAANGLLDASWAASYKATWAHQIGLMRVRQDINVRPEETLAKLEGGQEYDYLRPDDRMVLKKEAETAVHTREIRAKAGLETAVYKDLYDRFGGNPEMMRQALTNPEEMEDYGITLANAKSIEASITDLEKGKKSVEQQTERGYLQKLIKRQLTEAEIARDVDDGKIDAKTGSHWVKEITLRNEVIDPNAQAREIVRINRMITTGEDPVKIRDEILKTGNLKKEDKEQYIQKLEADLGQEVKEGIRLAYKDIEDVITPKRGMMANVLQTPSEATAVAKAQMALDGWVQEQKKAEKVLTRADIRQKGLFFGAMYQVSFAEKMQEMEDEAKRMALEGKSYAEIKAKRIEEEKKSMGKP